jgi:hypothetical protein
VQFLQVQPCDDVRRFYRSRRWRRFGRNLLHLFNGGFTIGTEMRPDFIREVVIKCTGVRLLVRNAHLRQVLDNHIAFHFQFTCQFVDPDLSHA